jgi:hypothetical protein
MAADTKSIRALRNRAVLLLGFAGAFRRSDRRIVADIVKAGSLALDPQNFGAHSLRSGLVTTAVKRGVNLLKNLRSDRPQEP